MSETELTALLEALLFVANEPLTANRLAELAAQPTASVMDALAQLTTARATTGIQVAQLNDAYWLVTAPTADGAIRRYLAAETRAELSRPALETLAIIAYRGPLTKPQLDELRGVSSDTMLRNLLQRGLIAEHAATAGPGKLPQYIVSPAFLQHFGLSSLAELPPLENPSEHNPPAQNQPDVAPLSPSETRP